VDPTGPIVRIAPNVYSIDSPSDTKLIYSGRNFRKTGFYSAAGIPHLPNIFSMDDEKEHSDRKRRIGSLYSITSVMHYEPAVDKINRACIAKLTEWAAGSGMEVNVPDLMQRYAFDVIGEITVRALDFLLFRQRLLVSRRHRLERVAS
jgi:cytochrome P450